MNLRSNTNVDIKVWDELITECAYSSPFQTSKYLNLFNSIEGLHADVFAIEEEGKYSSLAVVTIQHEKGIKSFFSIRGIIYGGPLILEGNNNSLNKLLESIKQHYRSQLIFLEVRCYFDYEKFYRVFSNNGFHYIPWFNFQLETFDITRVLANMSNSRSRQIKKSIKSGVTWKEAESENEVIILYDILRKLYSTKIKKPLLPLNFFLELFRQKFGKILIIIFHDKIIGGIISPILENKSIYEFYICGLDHEFKEQFPSVMATWAAIDYAYKNNIPIFDFMGAGSPDEEYGVREFKARFGGNLVSHGRYLYILKPLMYKVGKIGIQIMSKL